MKILFYVGYFKNKWNANSIHTTGVGGSEQCVLYLAKQLATKYDVYVVGDVIEDVIDNVEYKSIANANKDLKNQFIDCVIGVNYLNYFYELNQIKFDKSLFWLHNTEFHIWHRGTVLRNGGRCALQEKRLTRIICLSNWHKDYFGKEYPEIAHKISVIGNGVDCDSFHTSIKKKPGTFIYSSHAERGLLKVLEEWENITKGRKNCELHIATPEYGLEYYIKNFSEYVDELENVYFHGSLNREKLYELMSTCEYWYYPTDYEETFCITALEMLAHSVKPVTSCKAGLKETLNEFNCERFDDKLDFDEINEYVRNCDWKYKLNEWETYIFNMTDEFKIDCIYIIALHSNSEKIENWKKQIKNKLLIDYDGHLAIKNARVGSELSEDWLTERNLKIYSDWKLNDSDNSWWSRDMTPGELGCSVSHYEVWKNAKEQNFDRILVLEEDFLIESAFTKQMVTDLPDNWDMVYFGRNLINENSDEKINDSYVKPGKSYNSHAYILSASGVTKILDNKFNENIIPVDEYLICNYQKHERNDLHFFNNDMNVYAPYADKSIVKQTSKGSVEGPKIPANLNHKKLLYSFYDDPTKWAEKFISYPARTLEFDLILDEPFENCFSMPLFTREFCEYMIEEAEEANVWSTDRHEYFPTTDFLLKDIQFEKIYYQVLKQFVFPALINAYSLDGKGWSEMESEDFCARYLPNAQGHLSLHHDHSHLTSLVTLSDKSDYVGGGTYFSKQKKLVKEEQGYVSLHPGNITHKHGARSITEGSRYIIVSFLKNLKY